MPYSTYGVMTPLFRTRGQRYNPDRGYAACRATAVIAGALDLEEYRYDPETGACTGVIDGRGAVKVNPNIEYDPVHGYQWTGEYSVL